MDELTIFVEAVRKGLDLPVELREHAEQVKALSQISYGQSFLDLLWGALV